jgi:hypothetical protein
LTVTSVLILFPDGEKNMFAPTTPVKRQRLAIVLAMLLHAITVSAQALSGTVTQTAPVDAELDGLSNDERLHQDPQLLSLGSDIYANLQRALNAALDRNVTLLRVSLDEAFQDLTLLRLPPEQARLQLQKRLLREDVRDTEQAQNEDLWIPLRFEVDEAIGGPSTSPTRDATAGAVAYATGVMPMRRMSELLSAAAEGADRTPPDWRATLMALQRAEASIRWYVRIPVTGLRSAYNDVIAAYTVVLAKEVTPDERRQARNYLEQALTKLRTEPEQQPLADEVSSLVNAAHGDKSDANGIKVLIDKMRSRIEYERARAQQRYWDMVNPGK